MKITNKLNSKLLKMLIKYICRDNIFIYRILTLYIFLLLIIINVIKVLKILPISIKLFITDKILLFNLCYTIFLQDNKLLRIKKLNYDYTGLISFKVTPSTNIQLKVDFRFLSILSSMPNRVLRGIVRRILKKGYVVTDVGAFIGGYTFFFSELVGSEGKVYAFEPVPYLFNILKFHCSLFNFDNIVIENKAVAEHEGCSKLILNEENIQDNRLVYKENAKKYFLVNTISLDKYFEKYSILPDIIKIDVQGAEFKVFRGMLNLIKRKDNLTIICEFWPEGIRESGDDPLKFLNFVSELGFKIFEIDYKNNRISYVNNLNFLVEKHSNDFCDLILIK